MSSGFTVPASCYLQNRNIIILTLFFLSDSKQKLNVKIIRVKIIKDGWKIQNPSVKSTTNFLRGDRCVSALNNFYHFFQFNVVILSKTSQFLTRQLFYNVDGQNLDKTYNG